MTRHGTVVSLLTDFGLRDPYVGIMKGAILRRFPGANVVDLCHDVPAFDIEIGARFWAAARNHFPVGTVHVGVVDPGVGSARELLVVRAHECLWVAPDNGLVDEVVRSASDVAVRTVDLAGLGLAANSTTFHGRDIIGPLGAMLAAGTCSFESVGPGRGYEPREVDPSPRVLFADGFGNLITSVEAAEVDGVSVFDLEGHTVRRVATYADAERGQPAALVNSYGLLEFAVREGNAAEHLALGRGARVRWEQNS